VQRRYFALYNITRLVFMTELESVYCEYALSPYIKQSLTSQLNLNLFLKTLHSTYTVHLCVLYESGNKERLLPHTALTDWYL
jgi:hypothetical protein